MPKRIQRKRTKGWRMPPNAVYVGRPTVFGNPWTRAWVVGTGLIAQGYEAMAAVANFRCWLEGQTRNGRPAFGECAKHQEQRAEILRRLPELRGKNLACWCPLDGEPCHADVLLELANREGFHAD